MTVDLSVIIPVYDEQDNLRPLVEEITAALDPTDTAYEIIAIDDGSRDESPRVLRELAAEVASLKVVLFRKNCGQTAAFDAGFRHASGRVIVTIDADLQNDPADIPALVAALDDGYDVVSGWRRHRRDGAIVRRLPSWVANKLIGWFVGLPIRDNGCSLKAYRREIVDELRPYGEMHRVLALLAFDLGARIGEIPVSHRARRSGISKYSLSRVGKLLADLLTLSFLRRRRTKPMYFFGAVGAALMALALAAGGGAAWLSLGAEIPPDVGPAALGVTAVVAFVGALQLFGMGFVAELLVRTYFEAARRTPYVIAERIGFEG